MAENQNDEQNPGLENLEAPVQELTKSETDQVEGGYVGSANGGVWKVSSGPEQPPTLALTMKSTVVVSY